jgi:hypothetical protein
VFTLRNPKLVVPPDDAEEEGSDASSGDDEDDEDIHRRAERSNDEGDVDDTVDCNWPLGSRGDSWHEGGAATEAARAELTNHPPRETAFRSITPLSWAPHEPEKPRRDRTKRDGERTARARDVRLRARV